MILAGLLAVWAWQYGGWFGSALYPGTVVLAAGLILLALFAPGRPRLAGWPAMTLAALIGLGAWSGISALWSPSPDIAIEDAQRILTYAMAFGLGLWACDLLGPRVELAMAPLAFAGLFAGALAVGTMLTTEDVRIVLDEGTLQHPIGYRNANAAFFLIAAWPAVGLAASPRLAWWLRGLALGTAALCFQLGALGQSRASIIAVAAALAVYLVVSRERARTMLWLALAVGPALLVIPALTDLYDAAQELGRAAILAELDDTARAVATGTLVAAALGAMVALGGRMMTPSETAWRYANRAIVAGAVAVVIAGAVVFVAATGDPIGWIEDRAEEFQTQSSPGAGDGTRFGFNAGTERDDLWRVALDDFDEDPLRGSGGGAYYYSYLKGRSEEGVTSAHDAHSVELEFLGELGLPGLLLVGVALVGAAGGALSARSVSGVAALLVASAMAAAAYWLAHASIDWFWTFPALTAGVLSLLGAAAAPAARQPLSGARGRGRLLIVAGAVLLALSVVPPYLSTRYVEQAYDEWRTDIDRAYDDLGRAADWNPLDEDPLLAEGGIAREAGDEARAIDAFEQAAEKRPEEWAAHYFLATLYLKSDPARARREAAIAASQNPLSERVEALRTRLERGRSG